MTESRGSWVVTFVGGLCAAVLSSILGASALIERLDLAALPMPAMRALLALGLFASPAVLPLSVLSLASGVSTVTMLRRMDRGRRLRLGGVGLFCLTVPVLAIAAGVRWPSATAGTFTGEYFDGPLNFEPDLFLLCDVPGQPLLARGAELGSGVLPREIDVLGAAVEPPSDGWPGGGPNQWPSVVSDSHGTQGYHVTVRGRMVGPGNYGWPPYATYRLEVDTVLSVTPLHPMDARCF
jgi:hypothetical protein